MGSTSKNRGVIKAEREMKQLERKGFLCIHGHSHRTLAAMDRCEDGRSGAATGSRLELR
jgi:hypothetical protein